MSCRGCDDAYCSTCTATRTARVKAMCEVNKSGEQPGASVFQVRERFASAKTAREVQQWKAVKLIADLANATLRSTSMKPNELEDTLRTLRRTAQLATLRPRRRR